MSLKNKVAKDNIVFTAGSIAAAVLSFVFSLVATRLLEPEQYGLFAFSLVVMGFFTVFIDLGTSNTIIKFLAEFLEKGEDGKAKTVIKLFLKFRISVTLGISIFMLVFSEPIASVLFNKPGNGVFVMLAAGLLAGNSLYDVITVTLAGMKNFKKFVAIRLVERVMRIALMTAFVILGLKAVGATAGVIAALALVTVIGAGMLSSNKRISKAPAEGLQMKLILSFGFWAALGSVIISLYTMVDALLVSSLLSVENIGFYNIATSWVTLITYLAPVSYVVMYSYFSSLDKSKSEKAMQSSIRYSLLVAMPLGFLMSAFASPLIAIFYEPEFLPASGALALLGIASSAFVLSPLIMGFFYAAGKPKMHTAITAAILVFDAGLNFVFITNFGLRGAAAATLIARLVELAVFFAVMSKVMKTRIAWLEMARPLAASVVIYALALLLPVNGIFALVALGFGLLALYIALMYAIGGISRHELSSAMGAIKSRLGG